MKVASLLCSFTRVVLTRLRVLSGAFKEIMELRDERIRKITEVLQVPCRGHLLSIHYTKNLCAGSGRCEVVLLGIQNGRADQRGACQGGISIEEIRLCTGWLHVLAVRAAFSCVRSEFGSNVRFTHARLSLSQLISVATFSVYAILGNEFTASQIFPALSLFGSLSWVMLQVRGCCQLMCNLPHSLPHLANLLLLGFSSQKCSSVGQKPRARLNVSTGS